MTFDDLVDELLASIEPTDRGAEVEAALRLEAERLVRQSRPDPAALTAEQRTCLIESGAFTAEDLATSDARVARGVLRVSEQRTALQAIAASYGESEVAQHLGISGEEVSTLRAAGELFAFDSTGITVHPRWQFTADAPDQRLPYLDRIIKAAPEGWHPASLQGFMTTPQRHLQSDGKRLTPIQWLLQGRGPDRISELLESERWR